MVGYSLIPILQGWPDAPDSSMCDEVCGTYLGQFVKWVVGKDAHNKVVRWQVRGLRGMRGSSHPESKRSSESNANGSKGAGTNPRNTATPHSSERRDVG